MVNPTATSQADRGARRRKEILDGALRCFVRNGYEETTVEDIRRESGASVGSIYHHFGSKEAIALQLHLDHLRRWVALASQASRARGVRSAIRRLVLDYLDWIRREPDLFRFLLALPTTLQLRTFIREEIEGELRTSQSELLRWFEEEARRGTLRKLPAEMYNAIIFGPINQYASRWLRGVSDTGIETAAPILADAIVQALRKH